MATSTDVKDVRLSSRTEPAPPNHVMELTTGRHEALVVGSNAAAGGPSQLITRREAQQGDVMPDQQLMRPVLELDLAAYADVARVLEENLDVWAVNAFEDQIQSFVDHAYRSSHEH